MRAVYFVLLFCLVEVDSMLYLLALKLSSKTFVAV